MLYLVTLLRTAQFQRAAIAPHQAFLQQLRQQEQLVLAGPFTDQTGGAYLLRVESLAQAQAIAATDPLHTTGSSLLTVYEWHAQ